MGFEIVAVRMHGGNRPRLQVMAEPLDRNRLMTVDDCADISHAVSAILDVADPIGGAYTLEISSPGIDRPLTRLEDFTRFVGERVRIEVEPPLDNRRRFVGLLRGVRESDVLVDVEEGGPVALPFPSIRKAKLSVAFEPPAKPGKVAGTGGRKGSPKGVRGKTGAVGDSAAASGRAKHKEEKDGA
ncbi:ribosome maturation factor RimP [Arboricoccus pini]|uniref:Ribosome maturation factor RimP n=2 Tax=Arboricoccus pini TaxID=1963835 RepID=A0A212PYE6_9PROT|nr:ribosome maturation factor RimP [Arboricoccus pini]